MRYGRGDRISVPSYVSWAAGRDDIAKGLVCGRRIEVTIHMGIKILILCIDELGPEYLEVHRPDGEGEALHDREVYEHLCDQPL